MLVIISAVSVAVLLSASFGVGMAIRFRRRLEVSLRDLSAPMAVANQLLLEQQRYLQTFGDVVSQIFSHVREQHNELKNLSREVAGLHSAIAGRSASRSQAKLDEVAYEHDQLSQDRLLAELTHSLATPMSGLKARILSLCHLYSEQKDSGLAAEFLALKARIETCEAVLATFRRVNQTVAADRKNQLVSIPESLILVHNDTDRRLKLNTRFKSNIPESIDGFDNAFITTLLLPLVENAVEGSPSDGTVEVKFADDSTYVAIEVINAIREPVDMEKVRAPGKSTKDGHEGLGFPTAQWLAGTIRGGSLNASTNSDMFHVLVRLPRRLP